MAEQVDPKKQIELNKANARVLKLVPLDADPVTADLNDGDIWYVGAAVNKFRKRQNGVSKDLDAA